MTNDQRPTTNDQRSGFVTFGHEAVLPATLASVVAQHYRADALQIIVVDNGDGACAALTRRSVPQALVLEPGRNLGFAGGSVLGVAQSNAPIVVLVNPDVELAPTFIGAFVDALADPMIGIAGARLLNGDRTTLQHAGGELVFPLALSNHRGYNQPDGPPYDVPADVAYVTGAALGIRRTTWDMVGGFDEAFTPAYYEEVDLCMRVRQAGFAVRYVPAASAMHHESSGLGKRSIAFYRLYHLNRLRLLFKHRDDRWLANTWLPAELQHLRTTAEDNEIAGLWWAYARWQAHFLAGGAATGPHPDDWREEATAPATPAGSEIAWVLDQTRGKREIVPEPFRSRIPLVAHFQHWWNAIATVDYVRPLVQQQNDFNASLVELGATLERQRRTTDGAILCQGMLLAKVLSRRD
jgi:GT2 family glycosyltransferase